MISRSELTRKFDSMSDTENEESKEFLIDH